jgi:hypothetical protein
MGIHFIPLKTSPYFSHFLCNGITKKFNIFLTNCATMLNRLLLNTQLNKLTMTTKTNKMPGKALGKNEMKNVKGGWWFGSAGGPKAYYYCPTIPGSDYGNNLANCQAVCSTTCLYDWGGYW